MKVLPSAIGVSAKNDWEMNSICIQRKPGEAVGAICKLLEVDGSGATKKELIVNVEYNQLDPLLRTKWNKEGDIANQEGFSHFPGNTNTLIFKLKEYNINLAKSSGVIPEFVNPKYADAEKN